MKRLLLASIVFAAACGSKSKGPDTTAGGGGGGEGGGGAPVVEAPAKPWPEMNDEERLELMKTKVLPVMKAKFQAFNATEFAEFKCETCHGSGVNQGNFEMPNPELPVLTMAEVQNPDAEHKPWVDFMAQEVKPTMATLLGVPEWTPENPAGLGCATCHNFEQ
jgi:hypothetical protein